MNYENKILDLANYYDSKQTNNNIEALDYLVNGKPLSYKQYKELIVNPTINILDLKNTHRVLDVGCGFGGILMEVEKLVEESIGIDISQNLLNRFTGKSKTLLVSAIDSPFLEKSFDRIYMVSVSVHFPDFNYFIQVVNKLFSLLKDDGILLIGDQPLGESNSKGNYFRVSRHELIDYLDSFSVPYSIQVQPKRKRDFSNRFDIVIYKEKQ